MEYVFRGQAQTYYAPTDKVVQGILNCLTKRSACTCQVCGRSYGAVYRPSSRHTLCARCDVQSDLAAELQRWVSENGEGQAHKARPVIEFESLPANIKLLIPRSQIQFLRLVSEDREITYVTPQAISARLKTLKVMKRYLDSHQGL
jgi:hypothetical protein